ncbi:hypothetical protein PCE1_000412 [Barthelona sp. PCE]
MSFGIRLGDISDLHTVVEQCDVELTQSKTGKSIRITVDDCLACSGCITSAESILLETQSSDILIEKMKEEEKLFVSISPQSVFSIATHLAMEPRDAYLHIVKLFQTLHQDVSFSDLSTEQLISQRLFLMHYDKVYEPGKPLISSYCPGWVCYVEKFHPGTLDLLVPQVSPLIIAGILSKKNNSNAYHVSIQCCHDRKLEAIRPELRRQGKNMVDMVLTTTELISLIDKTQKMPIREYVRENDVSDMTEEWNVAYGNSGGFSDLVYQYLEGDATVEWSETSKSDDFSVKRDGEACVVKAYGFQALINALLALDSNQLKGLKVIEASACPHGCLNGGGQALMYNISNLHRMIDDYKSQELPFESILSKSVLDIIIENDLEDLSHTTFEKREESKQTISANDW